MDDYYSFAAFFAQVGRKQGEDYREPSSSTAAAAMCGIPSAASTMTPKFLGGDGTAMSPARTAARCWPTG